MSNWFTATDFVSTRNRKAWGRLPNVPRRLLQASVHGWAGDKGNKPVEYAPIGASPTWRCTAGKLLPSTFHTACSLMASAATMARAYLRPWALAEVAPPLGIHCLGCFGCRFGAALGAREIHCCADGNEGCSACTGCCCCCLSLSCV